MALANIQIDLIEVGTRVRQITEAQVEALIASIGDVGLLNPITLHPRKIIRSGLALDGYGVVAGAHRLEACKRLGLVEIDAHVVALSDLERQIAECDENLCASVLTKAERALFTKRRKDAYEALHPETKREASLKKGDELPSRQLGETGRVDRFTADTAAKTGQSERAVQRDAERGEKVIPEVLDMVRGTRLDTGAFLDRIKRLPPNDQVKATKREMAIDRSKLREAVTEAARIGNRGGGGSRTKPIRNPLYEAPSDAGAAWSHVYGTCRAFAEWATDENMRLAINGLIERRDDQLRNIEAVRRAIAAFTKFETMLPPHPENPPH